MALPETSDASETSVGSTGHLAQVKLFLAEQRNLPNLKKLPRASDPELGKLPQLELVKLKDLCEDIARFATGAHADRLERPTCLGKVFGAFECVSGATLRPPRRRGRRHDAPSGADPAPSQCATEFHLFDRLSQIYGGTFRGSVVGNCLLGVFASATVLYSLSKPTAMQWLIEYLPTFLPPLTLATLIELVCLVLIGAVYFRGNIRESDEHSAAPIKKSHWGAHRWHQRWLEYRLLAERFRYADLLLPLGANIALRLAIAPKNSASRMWHERYFKWRVSCATQSTQTDRQYRDHVLAVIAEQEDYHRQNHHRRGTIAHRLDRLAKVAFFIALGMCGAELAVAFHVIAHPTPWEDIVPSQFLAALFPVIAAAAYTILTHAEYAKAADASDEIFERIRELYEKLGAMPMLDIRATEDSLAGMASIVIEFAETSITEATGWRAMLRDKSIPLL